MWSVGCIFAEMMVREPYLPGIDKLDQLGKIFYALGTPTEENWPGHTALPDYVEFTPFVAPPLKMRFSAASAQAIDLLCRFLHFDPNARISAEDAMKHDYFSTGNAKTPIEKLPFEAVQSKS